MNTSDWTEPTQLPHSFNVFSNVYIALIVFIGLGGNSFCLGASLCWRELRQESMRIHVLALALSDLTFIATLSLLLLHQVGFDYPAVTGLCKMAYYLWYLSCFLSGWFILVMSAERCLAVYKPFLTPQLRRLSPRLLSVVTAVGLTLNLWIPIVTISRDTSYFDNRTQQYVERSSCDVRIDALEAYEILSQIDAVLSFTIPLLGVLVINTAILTRVLSATSNRAAFSADNSASERSDSRVGRTSSRTGSQQISGKLHLDVCIEDSRAESAQSRADGLSNPLLEDMEVISKQKTSVRHSYPKELKQRLGDEPRKLSRPQKLRQSLKRRLSKRLSSRSVLMTERKVTMVLVSVSLTYLCLNLPSYAIRIVKEHLLSAADLGSLWLKYAEAIGHLLFYSQFSVNFFLYSLHWILNRGAEAAAKGSRKRLLATPIVLNSTDITWSSRGRSPRHSSVTTFT